MEPSLWRSARELHPKFLAHAVNTQLFGLEYVYIDIPFHYHLFSFNLYPIALKFSANILHKFCVVLFMQSAFTIRNMDSTPEPPSPNMAAATPNKRKLRKCTNCTSRMPSFSYDNHTLCTRCRNQVCDISLFVKNAATGLLRNARFSLTITISYAPSANPNNVGLG